MPVDFDWGVVVAVVLGLILSHVAAFVFGGMNQRRRRAGLELQFRQERAFATELRMRLEKVVRSIDLAAGPARKLRGVGPVTDAMTTTQKMAAAIVEELERGRKKATEPVA